MSTFKEYCDSLNKTSRSDTESVANITTTLGQCLDHYLDKEQDDVLPKDYQQFFYMLNNVFLHEQSFVRILLDDAIDDARGRGGYNAVIATVEPQPPKVEEAEASSPQSIANLKQEAAKICKMVNGAKYDKVDELISEGQVKSLLILRAAVDGHIDGSVKLTITESIKLAEAMAKLQAANRMVQQTVVEAEDNEGVTFERSVARVDLIGEIPDE